MRTFVRIFSSSMKGDVKRKTSTDLARVEKFLDSQPRSLL